jgi:hypothetical protein
MPSYRRSAASLDELREQVLLAFGPEARIVEAARVTRRGVGPWLARDEIEATIEVPEGAAPAGGVDASRLDRSGIAALLADAESRDLAGAGGGGRDDLDLGDLPARRVADRGLDAGTPPKTRPLADDRGLEAVAAARTRPVADGAELGDAEPQMPSTSAPAFAALLAAVERSLGVDDAAGAPATLAPATAGHTTSPTLGALPSTHPADDDIEDAVVLDDAPHQAAPERKDGVHAAVAADHAGSVSSSASNASTSASSTASADDTASSTASAASAGAAGGRAALGRGAARRVVAPSAGDLVLLVGLGDDAVRVARQISGERGWPAAWVRVTSARATARGGLRGPSRASVIADRRAALSARSDALRLDREVLLAHAATLDDEFSEAAGLRPDLVWAVVDASRAPADTAEWIGRLDTALGVDALAIVGTAFTRDRATAERLGLPVAWSDQPEASA